MTQGATVVSRTHAYGSDRLARGRQVLIGTSPARLYTSR